MPMTTQPFPQPASQAQVLPTLKKIGDKQSFSPVPWGRPYVPLETENVEISPMLPGEVPDAPPMPPELKAPPVPLLPNQPGQTVQPTNDSQFLVTTHRHVTEYANKIGAFFNTVDVDFENALDDQDIKRSFYDQWRIFYDDFYKFKGTIDDWSPYNEWHAKDHYTRLETYEKEGIKWRQKLIQSKAEVKSVNPSKDKKTSITDEIDKTSKSVSRAAWPIVIGVGIVGVVVLVKG